MNNIDHSRIVRLQKKRERKRLKRKRKKIKYRGAFSPFEKEQLFRIKVDERIISTFRSNLYSFLIEQNFISGREEDSMSIKIPELFSLCENHDETIETIGDIIYSLWKNVGKEIEIDFSNCKYVEQSALFLLQIIRYELNTDLRSLDRRLTILSAMPKFKITKSNMHSVNLHLLLNGYIQNADVESNFVPIDTIGYIKGSKSQKHYYENRKGLIGTKIVNYLNKCLLDNQYTLTALGKNDLGNMIGEILNNAEDHSPLNTYYVTANYYKHNLQKDNEDTHVGVLNLSFLNFGYSIYEGLEQTKSENHEVYKILEQNYLSLGKIFFSKENIFTLYALQDGVSRLKYEDQSRGTGTRTFINCFYSIGDYENQEKKLLPQLSILSGATQLICNNKYRPTETSDGRFILSLNSKGDLSIPPDKSNLLSLKYKFPGTILSVRFCLNKEHIQTKIDNNGKK